MVCYYSQSARYILSNFIDFVDQNQWIFSFHFFKALDRLTRHRANVSSSVTLDLSYVGHATDTKPKIL